MEKSLNTLTLGRVYFPSRYFILEIARSSGLAGIIFHLRLEGRMSCFSVTDPFRINLLLFHPTFVCFFPVGLSSLTHFQQVLCVLKLLVSYGSTRHVQNAVLTTKGLQEKNTTVGWDDSGKIGKMIN